MKTTGAMAREAQVSLRIQQLTREVEQLIPELKAALNEKGGTELVTQAVLSLERAARAVAALAARNGAEPAGSGLRSMLEGTSPLMSLVGSRVVLAGGKAAPPSTGAQALALLLEEPARTFEAAEVAKRLGCSVPIARTTLNRLVQSGHASRPEKGSFRARLRDSQ